MKATNFLDIPSLTNAAAFFIANRVFQAVQVAETTLKRNSEYQHLTADALIIKSVINVLAPWSYQFAIRIAKYIYLQKHGVREKTIADYIGMNGIPSVALGELKLSHKGLTGLSGMELTSNNEARHANLGYNIILGNSLDLNLPPLPCTGLGNLQRLALNDNQLITLPRGVFSGLGNLQLLRLENNHLPGTETEFRNTHSIPNQATLIFSPQQTLFFNEIFTKI